MVGVVRMLVTSALVGAEGSARAGAGVAELTIRRTPSLVALGARGMIGNGGGTARAQAAFRDELLTLLDDVAELAWHEARRARDELGARTSPREGRAAHHPATAAGDNGGRRRHRVKA